MTEARKRIVEIIEEIRKEQERVEENPEVRTGFEMTISEPEQVLEARENAERYWRERAEELLDALNPQERRNEASDPATTERAAPHQDGLAVVVGHSRRSLGTSALSPPFPPGLGAEEYHWNSELALQIKALADKNGIRCRIFYRDGFDIPGAYVPVRAWAPRATVELHFNAAASPEVQGTETWYGHDSSIYWAAKLQAKMVKLYGRKGRSDRRTKDARDIDPGTGVPHRAHTSTTQIHPSALIEPFFDKNPDDCRMAVELKPGLARAIIEAYAEFAGASLGVDGAIVAPIDPAPQPTPVLPDPAGQSAGPGLPVANPSTPLSGVPESDLFASLRQLYLRSETSIAHPDLKIVTLAQWALESRWGTSGLATEHYNFAGMKGISEIGHLADIATPVNYQAHDGWDRYLRFGSLQNFITGYWRFLERSPYRGWKQHTASESGFIAFIASKWAPHDRQYVTKVTEIAGRLRRALTQGSVSRADGGPAPGASPGTPRGPGPQLSSSAIPADAVEFRKLFDVVTSTALENRALQGTLLAQCAIESNWGRSELARAHYNFAGIEWSDVLADFSAPVDYRRSDGTVGKYCRFLDHASFIKGYFARLDRDPRFAGWKEKAGDAKAFVEHIGPIWRPNTANYAKIVLAVLARLTPQAAAIPIPATPSAPAPRPQPGGGVTVSPGQLPDGYVIRVQRRQVEHRVGRGTRTVGDYSAFFRGQKLPGLEGMVFEAHGPGDNTATGTAHHRRLEAKVYPLGTHSSAGLFPKYATHGYTGSTIAGAQARPAIRLDNTGYRSGVLFHPGMGFLWSVGCLNFSKPLSGPDKDIDYTDSRARVIAVIEDMKARLGDAFPVRSWKTIPNAWMMIEGEPGPESEREGPSDRFDLIFEGGLTPDQRVDAARRIMATPTAISDADPRRLYDLAAAAMNGTALPEMTNPGLLQALVSAGADLESLRNDDGDNLWGAWADGIAVAAAIENAAEQTRVRRELEEIAALLKQSGVAIDDGGGLHTPLVRAAIGNQSAAIEALIAQGAQVDARDRLGFTPLIAGAFFGAADSIDLLLSRGADLGSRVAASATMTGPGQEVYAELPAEGTTALEVAEYGRSLVLYAPARDSSYERIVSALTRQ